MDFKPYPMDMIDLRRYNADLDNEAFQKKYTEWRNIYTSNGRRPAGMDPVALFLLATEFQKPAPVEASEPTQAEQNSEPVPEKRGPGRPRKELQTA